jgi:hypothetical protein
MSDIFCKYKYERRKIFIRNIILVALSIFLSSSLYSCTVLSNMKDYVRDKIFLDDDMDRAVETVDDFFALLIARDYEQAYGYLSKEDRLRGDAGDFRDEFKDVTDIVSIHINSVEIKNNIAIVNIDIIDSYDGEEKTFTDIGVSLIREEDEDWEIAFWD